MAGDFSQKPCKTPSPDPSGLTVDKTLDPLIKRKELLEPLVANTPGLQFNG